MSSPESSLEPEGKQTVNLAEEFMFNECKIRIPNDTDLDLVDIGPDSCRVNYQGREFIIYQPLKNINLEDKKVQLQDPLTFGIICQRVIGVEDALTFTGSTRWTYANGWICEVEYEGLLVNVPRDKFPIDLVSGHATLL